MVQFGSKIVAVMAAAVLLAGCHGRHYYPRGIDRKQVDIVRFDEALMAVDSLNAPTAVPALYADYPLFMPDFVEQGLGVDRHDTAYLISALPLFLADTLYGFAETNRLVRRTFADMRDINKEMNTAFSRLAYLYPDIHIPTVYTFVSGFNASVLFLENNDMAVGLDMYLGSDYPYYNHVVYNYQKQTMCKQCVAGDLVSGYVFAHFPFEGRKSRLIENMLYRGKLMYLCSTLLDRPAYEVMGYTREQWQWCERYERQVWNRMMDKRDLFKSEQFVLTSYLNDGPFTSEISQEAPPRIGTWIGWRIVDSYMRHHPEVSMQDLIAQTDAELILRESYYKP